MMLNGARRRQHSRKDSQNSGWVRLDLAGENFDQRGPAGTVGTDAPQPVLRRREGVADRVTVTTADMRQIPFPDGHFDVIVSNVAIHNL